MYDYEYKYNYNENDKVQDEDEGRVTRIVNEEFPKPVYIWYSESAERENGYGVYKSANGKLLKATSHTTTIVNPYPKSMKGELVGYVISLERMVDVRKNEARPERLAATMFDTGDLCNLTALSKLLLSELLSLSGMDHED